MAIYLINNRRQLFTISGSKLNVMALNLCHIFWSMDEAITWYNDTFNPLYPLCEDKWNQQSLVVDTDLKTIGWPDFSDHNIRINTNLEEYIRDFII